MTATSHGPSMTSRPRPLGSVAERVAQLAADLAELERDVAAARREFGRPWGTSHGAGAGAEGAA